MESTPVSEGIELVSELVRDLLSPHSAEDAKLVHKGLMLYRQGMVQHLQLGTTAMTATVQDVTPCRVSVEYEFLTLSECTCPNDEGLCRHQMAVFFAGYSKFGSVVEWVSAWREPMKEKSAFATWGLQTAKDLIKINGVIKPDYARWVDSFEVSFDTILSTKRYSSPFVISELFQIYERRIKASSPVEKEWRLLYELVGIVVSFRKLVILTEESGFSEDAVKRSYLHVFHNLVDDAEDLVMKIGIQSLPFDFDEFILKLKDDVFELLTVGSALEQERLYLYRLLWTNLFKKKAWLEEEGEKIPVRMKSLKDWENPTPLMLAGIHISFLQQQDEKALKLIESIDNRVIVPYMLDWINLLTQAKAWKRVGPLVEAFSQRLRGYLDAIRTYHSCSGFTRLAIKGITPYISETGRVDLYEKTLQMALPYSYGDYDFFLFDQKQFDKWGDLQILMGWSYYDLSKERVKVIEKERPELLLGMLHQFALSEINQKNRSSYKMAVRHLKRLRTLYKKLKRIDDWNYFLDSLMEKTKRLRAFHEECKRSKLVEE